MSIAIDKTQALDIKNNQIIECPNLYAHAGRVKILSGKCRVEVGVRTEAGYLWLETDDLDSSKSEESILYFVRVCEAFRFTRVNGRVNVWIVSEREIE